MALYNNLIGSMSTGSHGNGNGTITNWSHQWNPSSNNRSYTVTEDPTSPSGKILRVTHIGSTRTLLRYDPILTDPDRHTTQILALIRVNTVPSGNTTSVFSGIMVNGNGASSSETGVGAILGDNSTDIRTIHIQRYINGASSQLTNVSDSMMPNIMWVQLTIVPISETDSQVVVKTWAVDQLDQSPMYTDIVVNSNTNNSVSSIGIFSFFGATDVEFLWLSIGTGSDNAPRPETGNEVESPPSGDISVTAVSYNGVNASVSWNYTGLDITGIQYSLNDGTWISTDLNPFTISGLTNDTTYTIKIRPTNESGYGSESSVYDFFTSVTNNLNTWFKVNTWSSSVYSIKAVILTGYGLSQIADDQIGLGLKPAVLFNGQIRKQQNDEGIPIVWDGIRFRTLSFGEQLII